MGLFAVFATVSVFKGISGEASCGCFGEVAINPWVTAVFDVAVVAALVWARPRMPLVDPSRSSFQNRVFFRESTLCLGIFVLIGGLTYGWISQARYEKLTEVGQVLQGNSVQLVPESWIGQKFPLHEYILDGNDLVNGEKTILLSRLGCADCEKAKQNQGMALDSVVEISGNASSPDALYLTHEINWIAETPTLIELSDGVVKTVRNREDLISSEKNTLFGNASADRRRGFQ